MTGEAWLGLLSALPSSFVYLCIIVDGGDDIASCSLQADTTDS